MRRVPSLVTFACLVALGLFAVSAPSVHAAEAAPASFRVAVPAGTSASAHWRTPALRPARGFELVGARWRGEGGGVELRARRATGGWTRWARIVAGEPAWSGPAVAVQLRGSRPVRRLRVHAVAVGGATEAGARATAAAAGRPAIVPRSAWDPHDRCRPRVQARYGRIDFAVVHHTESLSAYSPAQSAALVLGICLFHRDGNRWNDLGYNLLVDRFGTVFEGRKGGVDQPVIGAQAGGWNTVSTGVAMIGSYTLAQPPPAALLALERVLAWKLSLAGLPAQGGVVERSIGGEPGVNAHPRGTLVRFQRIAGHRDADLTTCPGGALYALLPQLRRAVAARLPAARELLSIGPVGAPIEQAPWPLTGRLVLAGGRRPTGVPVRVEQQGDDGAWREVATTRTGVDGIWSAAPTLLANGALRAAATLPDARELASQVVDAQVRTRVRLQVATVRVRRGGEVRIAGTTTPPQGRVRVILERRLGRARFRRVDSEAVTTTDGAFAQTLRPPVAGEYRVRVTTPANRTHAAGSSRAIALHVRSARD